MGASSLGDFDREFTLSELLGGLDRGKLESALSRLLGASARLDAADGQALFGTTVAGGERVTVRAQLEAVGALAADASPEKVAAAAALIELLCTAGMRYLMASELHKEIVNEDFDELQRRHRALQASEARYRVLAEHLEARVEAQLKTLETAQRQLYQSEKMAAVGQLAAGVAHEINNPVGFIKSNLNTALGYLKAVEVLKGSIASGDAAATAAAWRAGDLDFVLGDFRELLAESAAGAERVARIVADLKGFSRVDLAEESTADVNGIIEQVCNVAGGQITEGTELTLALSELPPIRCRPGQLGQLFLNLLLNAVRATDGSGRVTVASDRDGDQLRVRVIDNGQGIAPEAIDHIFEPFFTTQEVGEGTGLGLTVAADIARAHGGRIEVESLPGRGSTFSVLLPIRSGDRW